MRWYLSFSVERAYCINSIKTEAVSFLLQLMAPQAKRANRHTVFSRRFSVHLLHARARFYGFGLAGAAVQPCSRRPQHAAAEPAGARRARTRPRLHGQPPLDRDAINERVVLM